MKTKKRKLGEIVGNNTYLEEDKRPLRIVRKYVEEAHSISTKDLPEGHIRELSMFLNAEKLHGTFEYNCILRRIDKECLHASKEVYVLSKDKRRNQNSVLNLISDIVGNQVENAINFISDSFKNKKITRKQKAELLSDLEDKIMNSYPRHLEFEAKIKSYGGRRISAKQYEKYYADLPSVD